MRITLYNISRFLKSSKCSKYLTNVKNKKQFFKKDVPISKYHFLWLPIPISCYFSSNYRHRLVLKIPFPKISNYRTENLYFPSTGKYYTTPPTPPHQRLISKTMQQQHCWLIQTNRIKIMIVNSENEHRPELC